ncbi:hypothetical protein MKZ20_17685 [Psychrobacillus sp. FSL K6-2684]|uniref:hypothetical protein n=1 Tax=Psychrobacillus sp. FSL K6-2684 TaxID=2921547 RepID=UPI0030F58C86
MKDCETSLPFNIDRDAIIFSISINTRYSEEYLEKLSDRELLETYERTIKN